MVDSSGNNLVFLLCTPRSGSSLATVMLQNHSKIFATQEMWFLMSLHDLQSPQRRAYGGTGILRQFFNGVMPRETFVRACRAFALQAYNELMRSSAGAELVIDKSPRYYYLLEFLDALFPQSRRIWLIRNPLAVLASCKKVSRERGTPFHLKDGLRGPSFDMTIADLTIGLFRYDRYFAEDNPYAHRLYYERLTAEPQAQLADVCRFLGISYEPGMEKYGDHRHSAKADLFYSMGVGDPFVAAHTEPNQDSIHIWKDVLDRQEIEMYVRTLGARLFRRLGYGEQLEEAEQLTGARFEQEPDTELLTRLSAQLAEATGCRWEDGYRMRNAGPDAAAGSDDASAAPVPGPVDADDPASDAPGGSDSQLLQLQMTVNALERRLEHSVGERRRLQAQLESTRRKIGRLKAMIPFGNRLSHLASTYLNGGWKQ